MVLPGPNGENRLLTKPSDVYSLGMVILHVNCFTPPVRLSHVNIPP